MSARNFLLFLFAILIGCAKAPASSDLDREFVDSEDGYRMRYPSEWHAKDFPGSRDLVKAEINNKDNTAGVQVRIYDNKQGTFGDFIAWYKSDFSKQMKGAQLIGEKRATISGIQGCSLSFDGRNRKGYFLKSYLIPYGEIVYIFQCGAPFEKRSAIEPVIDAIAGSFEIH